MRLNALPALGLTAALLALGACSPTEYTNVSHPSASDEQLQAEALACGARKDADKEGLVVTFKDDADWESCMKAKGYVFEKL